MAESTARLLPVWDAMAEHFLDTEVRHRFPHTALTCLDAGLSPLEARDVWRKDIAPTLAWNLLSVAGEWALWEEAWLIAQIAKTRRANWLIKLTSHRGFARLTKDMWLPIEKSMRVLEHLDQTERRAQVQALSYLTRVFIDFVNPMEPSPETKELVLMRQLYPEPFSSILQTAICSDERASGVARVREFLGESRR